MAMTKAFRAALKALTVLEPNITKTYKAARLFDNIQAWLRGQPSDYIIWDRTITVADREVPVRVFSPLGEGPFPLLIFFHGGGWVTGGIDNYTGVCADLAKALNCRVASVDYRLAPEHRFPAGLDDCYAVTREFFARDLPGIIPGDITLVGDSAGGNLAAAVSLMARDRGEFMPQRQILIYPSLYNDHSKNSPFPSMIENGSDYLLTADRMRDFIELYQSSDDDLQNPYFAPLISEDLSNQPATLVITAQYCPLRDEGAAYATALSEAGVHAESVMIADAVHGYMMLPPRFEQVRQTYDYMSDFLGQQIAQSGGPAPDHDKSAVRQATALA